MGTTIDQKQLWEKLAKENSLYYINSDYGKRITEKQFRDSGLSDFYRLIENDESLPKKGVLLEIGCGNGRMTEFIAQKYQTLGVDISKKMIIEARQRVPNVYFSETDGYIIPFDDSSIDIVFSYLVFQHFKTQEMLLSNFDEAYRVLKAGGIMKVRVRSDKIDSMRSWWAGVTCDVSYPINIGFKLLKEENVKDYGKWLWLQK